MRWLPAIIVLLAAAGIAGASMLVGGDTINTFAGSSDGFSGNGGAATSAKVSKPQGIFVDSSGDVFIADTENHQIRKVAIATGIITAYAGVGGGKGGYSGDGGAATAAELKKPRAVWKSAAGNIIFSDSENHVIRSVNAGGTISRIAGDFIRVTQRIVIANRQ